MIGSKKKHFWNHQVLPGHQIWQPGHSTINDLSISMPIWLVVSTYPSEKYESQLGWWHSQLNGNIKFMFQTFPNHQSVNDLSISMPIFQWRFPSYGWLRKCEFHNHPIKKINYPSKHRHDISQFSIKPVFPQFICTNIPWIFVIFPWYPKLNHNSIPINIHYIISHQYLANIPFMFHEYVTITKNKSQLISPMIKIQ